jgi:hypothetical protein
MWMPITEGNLFAKMRLTLPEHRAMVDEVRRLMNRNPVPRAAEDVHEQWEHVLRDAALRQLPVRITLIENGRETHEEGIPVIRGGELRLRGRGAWRRVNVHHITRVEAL